MITKENFNINTIFTEDVKGFWDDFFIRDGGIGKAADDADPDIKSKTLKMYHQFLWSKELPNGEFFNLKSNSKRYLFYKDMTFGSDSITTAWRYKTGGCKSFIYELKAMGNCDLLNGENYETWIKNGLLITYTSGGMMIFPKHVNSINGRRGCIAEMKDRFDLTLKCIKQYYDNPNNEKGYPQDFYYVLKSDNDFFKLFVDFKGFVDFFYLNDWCDSEYNVKLLFGKGDFSASDALPSSLEEYVKAVNTQRLLVKQRNERIQNALNIYY